MVEPAAGANPFWIIPSGTGCVLCVAASQQLPSEEKMGWRSKFKRVLKYTSVVLSSLGITAWVWAMSVYQSYLDLPSSPNPATGSVYPLNIHGSVVYQTLQQKLYRERWEFWSWVIVDCGAALFAIYKWISEKKGTRTQ